MLKQKPKPKDFLMWNGVDLELYLRSHNPMCLWTVLDFLDMFKWDKRVEELLRYLLLEKYKIGRTVKSRVVRVRKKEVIEPFELGLIIGICPRCGEPLFGEPMPNCELQSTGRYLLKLCKACPYYSELFRKDKKIIEIEGD